MKYPVIRTQLLGLLASEHIQIDKRSMRRQACTINWPGELPLAQGIRFEIP
jgi:hypothetical protein